MHQETSSSYHWTANARWGAICMGMSLVFFTANALLLKWIGSAHVSAWLALTFRAGIGMLLLLVFFPRKGQVDYWRAATSPMHICRGAFGVVGTAAYYFTIQELGPGKATLISNTYVVMAALLAIWLLREPLRWPTLIGIIFAGIGLYLLLNLSTRQWNAIGLYELVAVVGAFCAAVAVVAIKQLTATDTSATIFASQCIFVLLIALPMSLAHVSELTWPALLLLTIAGTSASCGQLAMTEGFRHLSVAVGGTFQIMVPMLIAVSSVFFFHEFFSSWQIVGGCMILVGCYGAIVNRLKLNSYQRRWGKAISVAPRD